VRQDVIGNKALFDSNIIIYLSKRELPFSFVDKFDDHFISVITYMEILSYNFSSKSEENFIIELLDLFKVVYINRETADEAIEIRKKNRIKLPDAIIAATAIINELFLVTRNIDDFKNVAVNIINPFAK